MQNLEARHTSSSKIKSSLRPVTPLFTIRIINIRFKISRPATPPLPQIQEPSVSGSLLEARHTSSTIKMGNCFGCESSKAGRRKTDGPHYSPGANLNPSLPPTLARAISEEEAKRRRRQASSNTTSSSGFSGPIWSSGPIYSPGANLNPDLPPFMRESQIGRRAKPSTKSSTRTTATTATTPSSVSSYKTASDGRGPGHSKWNTYPL